MPQISIVVAVDEQNAIGKDNDLLCYLPNDLKHFKTITNGQIIIMGRRTFDSLPKGALPNRRNIVVSRNKDLQLTGCEVYTSIQQAIELCKEDERQLFIIGGGSIYNESLLLTHKLYVTHIHHTFEGADTFFPAIDASIWQEVEREDYSPDDKHPFAYSFVLYQRL